MWPRRGPTQLSYSVNASASPSSPTFTRPRLRYKHIRYICLHVRLASTKDNSSSVLPRSGPTSLPTALPLLHLLHLAPSHPVLSTRLLVHVHLTSEHYQVFNCLRSPLHDVISGHEPAMTATQVPAIVLQYTCGHKHCWTTPPAGAFLPSFASALL